MASGSQPALVPAGANAAIRGSVMSGAVIAVIDGSPTDQVVIDEVKRIAHGAEVHLVHAREAAAGDELAAAARAVVRERLDELNRNYVGAMGWVMSSAADARTVTDLIADRANQARAWAVVVGAPGPGTVPVGMSATATVELLQHRTSARIIVVTGGG